MNGLTEAKKGPADAFGARAGGGRLTRDTQAGGCGSRCVSGLGMGRRHDITASTAMPATNMTISVTMNASGGGGRYRAPMPAQIILNRTTTGANARGKAS